MGPHPYCLRSLDGSSCAAFAPLAAIPFVLNGVFLSEVVLPSTLDSFEARSSRTGVRRYCGLIHVASVVPETDHRSGEIVFVAQGTDARRAQHKISAVDRRLEPEPARRHYPHEMPARESKYIPRNGTQSANDAVRTGADLQRCLASGAAVAEQVPVRSLRADFCTTAAFIFAIVPLDEVSVDLGHGAKPRQFASLARALQWTGEHLCESQPLETFTESPSGALAMFR